MIFLNGLKKQEIDVCHNIVVRKSFTDVEIFDAEPIGSAFLFYCEKKLMGRLGYVQAKFGRDFQRIIPAQAGISRLLID